MRTLRQIASTGSLLTGLETRKNIGPAALTGEKTIQQQSTPCALTPAVPRRKHEVEINSLPHYTAPVKDDNGKLFSIHFLALYSERRDATPLVLLHGWPGSFLEFIPILKILSRRYTPETLPYHVIVPSLPGYTFSSPPPLDQDFSIEDVARIINKLVVGLGFGDGYVVQGGDIGSDVSRILAAEHPSCKAVHSK
jgi:microsomal epoxide hydrolase